MSLQPNPWLQTLGKYHHLDETELEHRPQAAGAALTAEDISSTDEYFFGEGNNTSSAAPSTKSFLDFDFEEEFQDVSPLPEGESLILPRLLMLGHWLLLSGKACMFLNCPCCLGRPCTSEKRAEYKRMTKTFVLSITVLQVIMFVITVSIHGFASPASNPAIGPPQHSLVSLGARETSRIVQHWNYVFPLFTPALLHAGVLHLVVNLYVQLRMGLFLERRWSVWTRVFAVYWVCAVGSVLAGCVLQPASVAVHSSPALFGLLGAYFLDLVLSWHRMERRQRKVGLLQCLLFVAVLGAVTLFPFVDLSSQVFGFLIGMLCGIAMFAHHLPDDYGWPTTLISRAAMVVIALVLAGLAVALAVAAPDLAPGPGSQPRPTPSPQPG
eukprot:CAMPEP_0177674078 /NCGR_PEP_ID=MMETSP0447-20121125/26339_1 /TAXON_ID=0 /ORGANISM="Stygamoeba regulata, Strain BSH-02190019" /LENGTH=381 /DNA_ID=CAMNT_0019182101 /DNA_START=56 /DNA_END=1201 /DNA_ORIENTATION=-